MRALLKLPIVLVTGLIVLASGFAAWFFLYSGDLPQLQSLVPVAPGFAADSCTSRPIPVIPYSAIGPNLEKAIIAAETADSGEATRMFSLQTARWALCNFHGRMLHRQLKVLRFATQLRRKFTTPQLLTMYVNQAYFGDETYGIQAACRHYYGKRPSELSLSQAALIAGLLKAPAAYSPTRHPDRARQRRDQVLDQMVTAGAITAEEGEKGKRDPL